MRGSSLVLVALVALGLAAMLLVWRDGQTIAGLADHQFADLVRLGAIGALVASGVLFAVRSRPGRALVGALVWITLFAILIIGYAFSSDLALVRDRVVATLVPGTAIVSGTGEDRQVMVMRGRDDHFRIDATLNGVRVPMLVDTGASVVALDRSTAEAIGVDVDGLRYTARVRTANGVTSAAPVRIETLRVGDIERRNVEALVAAGEGIGIDLLGMSFLGTLASVDFRGDRLVLTE